jgi:hypothetical protein
MCAMPRHDTACPWCLNSDRVRIRRLNGSIGLYCPSCKFVEEIAQPVDYSAPGERAGI